MSAQHQLPKQVCAHCGSLLVQTDGRLRCTTCIIRSTSLDQVEQIGPYHIDSPLGHGGMGEVFLGFHEVTGRAAALKVPYSGGGPARDSLLNRFAQEARLLSLFDHPSILPIYEVGESHGLPWFAMKLAEGGTLADYLNEHGPMTPARAAALLASISSAVQYAHDHGILHRDIKPHNILLDETDAPMLGDFGLARETDRQFDLSRSIAALGTPGYSAPEISRGRAPSAEADIFSLGAVLYHLLAGVPPFSGSSLSTTLELTQLGKVEPLTRRGVPLDLWRICRKCLEPEPADRYPSAETLEQDLRAWLEGRALSVRRLSPLGKLSRIIRRNPLITALILTTAIAVIVSLSFVILSQKQLSKAEQVRDLAEQELSVQQRHIERLDHIRLLLEIGRAGNRQEALTLLREEWQHQPGETLRSLAIRALSLGDIILDQKLTPPEHNAFARTTPPREQLSPVSKRKAVIQKSGREIHILHPNGQLEVSLQLETDITALQWNSRGDQLAVGCFAKDTYLWRAGQQTLQRHVRNRDSVSQSFAWHPNDRFIACTSYEGSLHLWDVERRQDLVTGDFYIPANQTPKWNAEGTALQWNLDDGSPVVAHITFPMGVRMLRPDSPSGRRETFRTLDINAHRGLVVWTTDEGTRLWDLSRNNSRLIVQKQRNEWLGVKFTRDGVQICGWSSGLRGLTYEELLDTARLPDVSKGQPHTGKAILSSSRVHPPLLALLEGPRHRFCLTRAGENDTKYLVHQDPYEISLSADESQAATTSFQAHGIKLWDLKKHQAIDLPLEENASSPVFSPDGRTLAAISRRHTTLWNTTSGELMLNIYNSEPSSMADWSPDNKLLAVISAHGTRLLRPRDGAMMAFLSSPVPQPGIATVAIAFDKDQRLMGNQLEDGSVILWNLQEIMKKLEWLGMDWPED